MRRAIELAELGLSKVSPNPMVGCVIVHEGRIIGEGYHEKYGKAHAEVNAIASVSDLSVLSQSTVYVTLEPCAHFGKTPPCADLLIEKGVKTVVIGCRDPFLEVDGKGIDKLKEAGVRVEVGVLEYDCRALNKRFFTSVEEERPFVILKWARTEDGFIARENYDSKWISNQYSRQLVHKWRSEEDAILVGKNTAKYDNPSLTVRDWIGENPIRVVLDNKLELPDDLKLFDNEVETLIFNTLQSKSESNTHWVKYDGSLKDMLVKLHERKIQSLFVEGGSTVLTSFIENELWDEARVFSSKTNFEKGIEAPGIGGLLLSDEEITEDRLEVFKYVR